MGTRNTKEFALYHVWNRNDLNEIWVYDKKNKHYYFAKYFEKCDFDLSHFLFLNGICSSLSGNKKSFNKIHEDDFYSRINENNYTTCY